MFFSSSLGRLRGGSAGPVPNRRKTVKIYIFKNRPGTSRDLWEGPGETSQHPKIQKIKVPISKLN